MAQRIGAELAGPYAAIYCSPAKRAAETVAWFLKGLNQQLPQQHGVVPGLAEGDPPELARTVSELLASLPDGTRGLAVGHTPLLEAAAGHLTGTLVQPLRECEGVLLVEDDDGAIRIAEEYRRET